MNIPPPQLMIKIQPCSFPLIVTSDLVLSKSRHCNSLISVAANIHQIVKINMCHQIGKYGCFSVQASCFSYWPAPPPPPPPPLINFSQHLAMIGRGLVMIIFNRFKYIYFIVATLIQWKKHWNICMEHALGEFWFLAFQKVRFDKIFGKVNAKLHLIIGNQSLSKAWRLDRLQFGSLLVKKNTVPCNNKSLFQKVSNSARRLIYTVQHKNKMH